MLWKHTERTYAKLLRGVLQKYQKVFGKITEKSCTIWQKKKKPLAKTQGVGLFPRSWPFIQGGQKIKNIYREWSHLQISDTLQSMKNVIQGTKGVMIYKYEEIK